MMDPMLVHKAMYILLSLCSGPVSDTEARGYAEIYVSAATRWELALEDVLGVALYENRACDPGAVSKTNDVGLMQIHTLGGRQIAVYTNPKYNIERGCEKLWEARRRGGKRETWLQRYNPGSSEYSIRVCRRIRLVQRKGREFDARMEALRRGWGIAQFFGG